jgi:hypothetical protein
MKKIYLLFIMLIHLNISAQKEVVWFDWGIKLQGGGRGFYNKAVEDAPKINHELGLSTGQGIGLKLGVNWQYQGLSLEGFYNRGKQSLENLDASNYSYDWTSIDIYPLYRNAQNLGYFELGPKVSFLGKANRVNSSVSDDVTSSFNKLNYGAVMGFGANIMGNEEAFSGILGLRFEYGLNDFIKTGDLTHPINTVSSTRSKTIPFFAGLVFEFNFGIGYFGRAQCGARSKFIMF